MFGALTDVVKPPVTPEPSSECGPAEWSTVEEVNGRCASASWLPFVASFLADPDY
jgi:hypothetical protein